MRSCILLSVRGFQDQFVGGGVNVRLLDLRRIFTHRAGAHHSAEVPHQKEDH